MRAKFLSFYNEFHFPVWSTPIFFLIVSILSFGLLIPNLGYYMDDWHHVYYSYVLGADGLREMLLYGSNRPYAAWFYIYIFNIFGYKPLGWHITALVLRWGTVTFFWMIFRILWSKFQRQVLYAALLFLIYPFFMMQPMAVAYSLHWMGFLLYAFSVWLMLLAVRGEGVVRFGYTTIALIATWYHLVTSEYFSGFELLRPVLLWILLSRQDSSFSKRIKTTLQHWTPYLAVLFGYVYWRFFLLPLPPQGDRNTPTFLLSFLVDPVKTAISLFNTFVRDSLMVLVESWQQILSADLFAYSSLFDRAVIFVMLISFVFVFMWVSRMVKTSGSEDVFSQERKKWQVEVVLVAVTMMATGPLPVWFIGKSISSHKNIMAATRFGLASMLGASLIVMLVIDFFITNPQKAHGVIALLTAFSVGVHLDNAHFYEFSWEKQVNLYQQFVQRVPALEENTAIISGEEVLPVMGEYPTAYALNAIYSNPAKGDESNYWFYAISSSFHQQPATFFEGIPLEEDFLLSNFSGHSKESLYISYEPGRGQCLWVLRPEDADLRLLSDLERQASLNSAIDRIQIEQEEVKTLPAAIFGEGMPQSWCSYYQRADLARQRGNWQEVVALWEEALANGKRPENGFEYIPFIEGYAHEGQWRDVKKLTRNANKVSQGMAPILCNTLIHLEAQTPASVERDTVMTDLFGYLGCDIE